MNRGFGKPWRDSPDSKLVVANMTKVEVFQVAVYDVIADAAVMSRRMATSAGVKLMGGWPVGPPVAIDASELEPGAQWTPIDFKPSSRARGRPALPKAAAFDPNAPRKVALEQRPSLPKALPIERGMFDPDK
jgi:hypothetical protein